MNEPLHFWVPGNPRSQGSGRVLKNRNTGEPIMVMTTPQLRAWRKEIGIEAKRAAARLKNPLQWHDVDEPVVLGVCFVFRKLKARRVRKLGDVFCHVKPDLDKLIRAVGDALEQAHVVVNDSRICALFPPPMKVYRQEPGVAIHLSRLDERRSAWLLKQHERVRGESGVCALSTTSDG